MSWWRGPSGVRSRRRVARVAAVSLVMLLALGVSTESATADQLRLSWPSWSGFGSWVSSLFSGSPSFSGLPQQASGTAAGRSHDASAADTHASGGAGSGRGKGAGELPGYQPHARAVVQGASATVPTGFDARTSRRVAAKSSETMTYFQNADGSVTRTYSQGVVNYRDAAGGWQPIDTTVRRGGDGRWHEAANSRQVDFAAAGGDPALVSFALDAGHRLAYGLQGAAAVTPTVSGSTLTYPAVLPGTDVKLAPTANGLKESLVLHGADAAASWVFPLQLTGLSPVLAGDGSVNLVDSSGAVRERIPHGYAYDSKVDPVSGDPATTSGVSYALTTVNGGPALTMSLDPKWLADPARAFPVTVDPTFWDVPTTTYAEADNPVGDHSMEMTIKVGSYNSGPSASNSFLQFPKDLDNSGVTVTSAMLQVFDSWASTCTAERFDVAPVTQSWTPSGVTSYPGPSYGGSIGNVTPSVPHACANTAGDRTVGDWVYVNLSTATIQAWANGTSADYGFALYASTTDNLHWKQFDSGNMWGYNPALSVTTTGDVPPQVDTMYPGNAGVATTLTPTLIATGHDMDAYPNASVQYDFQIYDSSSTKIVDSGLVGSGNWTVPSGNLKYGQTYYWAAQTYDGQLYSTAPAWNALSIEVPQPSITSSLSQNGQMHGVDPSVGNYTTSMTDAEVPATGPSLSVVRYYNSRDPRVAGGFGAGWSSLVDLQASEQYDASGAVSSVVVTYPDGAEVGYGKNADGTFSPPLGRFATFKAITGGYSLTDKNDTTYTFTQSLGGGAYGATSITDANGRAETFTWASGQITTITSVVSGRALHLTWSTPTGATAAHVASVATDPATPGQPSTALTWTYSYSADQLASVCPPGTTTACTQYQYSAGSQYRNQALDLGPRSFWSLGEASGSTAASSVLANAGADAATYSNVTLGQPGPLAGSGATAAGFNGTSSTVTLPRNLVSGMSTQSISLWFKTTAANGVLFSYSALPLSFPYTTGFYTPGLYVGSDGKLAGEFWMGQTTPITSANAVTDGAWHHVVLAASGNSQTMWLDGTQVGTLAGTVSVLGPQSNYYLGGGYNGGRWPDEANYSSTSDTGKPIISTGRSPTSVSTPAR